MRLLVIVLLAWLLVFVILGRLAVRLFVIVLLVWLFVFAIVRRLAARLLGRFFILVVIAFLILIISRGLDARVGLMRFIASVVLVIVILRAVSRIRGVVVTLLGRLRVAAEARILPLRTV
ncbi:MAG: hypothetical protein IIB15_03625 [Chloroflexi bacterium]|nr:hypothetical protein [Chloroflexota bacterium]